MADEPTAGEVYRLLQDHKQQSALEHRSMDERITQVARDSLPLDVYQADQRARDREERARDKRLDGLEQRPALTAGRIAVIATAVIALAALLVQAYGTLKGAK